MTEAKPYKETVNLPQTQFDMRANAATREPQLQQFWEDEQIYQHLSQHNPNEPFILHDGPPYANGSLHIGHALNKTLKDIINRYQLLKGRKVRYIPGWDCHGLPIELKVLQTLKPEERRQLTPLQLRHKARDFALATVEEQRQSFKRYGVWGDWAQSYLTLTPEYEAAQIGVFGKMALKGHIYRGFKPVHWSPSSQTALAEAELEYPEGHVSPSIYVAFPITQTTPAQLNLAQYLPNLYATIWTTTPWTIPANLAISVNPALTYAVVKTGDDFAAGAGKSLIVAADAVERLAAAWGTAIEVLTTLKGQDLEHCTYRHTLFDRTGEIVIGGDYVTTESGTGLVHTAPGHGLEDYQVGLRYNLPIFSPVDALGNFTEEAEQFAGLNVLKNANEAVIQALQDADSLVKHEPYSHKYPYDWRTKKPTIFRATEQWFASVDGFRDEALQAIAKVDWIPEQGENRITSMVQERSDWCISRQRNWGVPIPVFYDEETNEPLLNAETIAHVQAIIAEKGSDAWWELSIEELLPASYRNGDRQYRKGTDTMDVWFDSGSSWSAVAQQRGLGYPVDLYLEGSDQHRGWFQSSLLTSVAANGVAPYKQVLTHGFVLDEQGRKMSKSLGNVVDPAVVIDGGKDQKKEPPYGADVLRLWVSSVDYSNDVPLGQNILRQMGDVYRKIRNTARFLLGNLHDFDPAKDAVVYDKLPELDRYMLHRMTEVFADVTEAFETYQFSRFFQTVQNFCVVDLSNFYLDMAKDRLYISARSASRRRSCQTVLAIALENLARAIAPVLCHMAEDIWQNLPYPTPHKSVFAAGWVQVEARWKQPQLAEKWQQLRQYRAEVNKVMESARAEKLIGSSLDAKVLLYVADAQVRSQLKAMNPTGTIALTRKEAIDPTPTPSPAQTAAVVPVQAAINVPAQVEFEPPQIWPKPITFIAEAPELVAQATKTYTPIVTNLAIVGAALAVVSVGNSVLHALNKLVFFPLLFSIVGVGATAWWLYRRVLFAQEREKLQAEIAAFTQKLMGPSQPQLTGSQPKAIAPATVSLQQDASVQTLDVAATGGGLGEGVGNGVDELRYLFISSQVEVVDTPDEIAQLPHQQQSEEWAIAITKADGEKCDRCWNYSTHVGSSSEHPTICDRCVAALSDEF